MEIKPLGVIERFNGVNITEVTNLIKVFNRTYITKIPKDKDGSMLLFQTNIHHAKYLYTTTLNIIEI